MRKDSSPQFLPWISLSGLFLLNFYIHLPKLNIEYMYISFYIFCFMLLCPMSESPSRKREGFQDNATGKKGKFITDSSHGPLLHPTQWCRSESPEPKLLHKFIG